jgi:hypothetical protein
VNYLLALKNQNAPTLTTDKTDKRAYVSFVSTQTRHILKNEIGLMTEAERQNLQAWLEWIGERDPGLIDDYWRQVGQ